ncbi:MAG TPA: hypothetical protein VKT80_17795, partial [Chloroflexota bacterium]|nr:hypothetical protein [Chloroflexota bacterium]
MHPWEYGTSVRQTSREYSVTDFRVVSDFQPTGDQPTAIAKLVKGVREGMTHQTLLGVTGSGKTFTMAKV